MGDVFNDAGTLAAFGFIVAYILVTIAAPLYVQSLGQIKPMHLAIAGVSLLLLLFPPSAACIRCRPRR